MTKSKNRRWWESMWCVLYCFVPYRSYCKRNVRCDRRIYVEAMTSSGNLDIFAHSKMISSRNFRKTANFAVTPCFPNGGRQGLSACTCRNLPSVIQRWEINKILADTSTLMPKGHATQLHFKHIVYSSCPTKVTKMRYCGSTENSSFSDCYIDKLEIFHLLEAKGSSFISKSSLRPSHFASSSK